MNDLRDRSCGELSCPCGSTLTGMSMVFREQSLDTALHYVKCVTCGLWRMSPQPKASTLAESYSSAYYGTSRNKFVCPVAALVAAAQRIRARKVLRYLAMPRPHILDIGCGNGGYIAAAQSLGAVCEGTELSAESAARVSDACDVIVHTGGIERLVEEQRTYDAITLWHVIEHLRDPFKHLAFIHDLLRPGGMLFISAPNHDSWQASIFRERWFHLDPPRHLWGFSPESLRSMLGRYGFATLQVDTLSLEQNPYGIIQSVLNCSQMPHNSAYETLKGVQRPFSTWIRDLLCVGVLTLPALVGSLVESAAGRGGTFCLVARKGGNV